MEQLGTENHLCLSAPEGTQPHRSVFHDPLSQACSLRCFWHYIGVASHIYNKAPGARAAPPDHLPFALVRQGDGEQLQGLQEAEGGGGGGGAVVVQRQKQPRGRIVVVTIRCAQSAERLKGSCHRQCTPMPRPLQ